MAPRVRTPGREWLTDRISQGFNDSEMAELWFEESGEQVTHKAINRVVRLHDLRPKLERMDDVIPWQVQERHTGHWYHKLLYIEGHMRRNQPVSDRWRRSLENFKNKLKEKNAVVGYIPDSEQGFYLFEARRGEDLITTRGRSKS